MPKGQINRQLVSEKERTTTIVSSAFSKAGPAPLSSAAVLATLDEFESGSVIAQGEQLAGIIEAGLIRLKETGVIAKVRGEGCVWGVECSAIGSTSSNDVAVACVEACYLGDDDGNAIHLLGALAGNVLRVSPPLTMDPEELQFYLDVMYKLFRNVAESLQA